MGRESSHRRLREDEVGKGVELESVAFCYNLVREDEVALSLLPYLSRLRGVPLSITSRQSPLKVALS